MEETCDMLAEYGVDEDLRLSQGPVTGVKKMDF